MDILNNQQIPFSKDIVSDMTSLPNTTTSPSSGISFENYLKAVNDSIEKQERRERNDYNDREDYRKDPYIERREPYTKDRYNEDTSRGGFASADNYNKPTNKSMFNVDKQRSSVVVASGNNGDHNNYHNNETTVGQEYDNVENNPIQIGNIYQNRSRDKVLGETVLTGSTDLVNTRTSSGNLSIASLAYKIHSLLNVESLGDEALLAGKTPLDEMSMKDLLSIINNMSTDELDTLNNLVEADKSGISELELSNLGEIEDLITTAQQNGTGNNIETKTDSEVDVGLPIVSDKSGLLDEQDIINFYESNVKVEKTTNDTLLVESLKANKGMLLTEGNILSADVILSGSKNKDINNIDTSIIDLIKQVSSKDNDEDSLLDLIKKIAGDIDTEELDNSSKNLVQSNLKDTALNVVREEVLNKEVVSKEVVSKDVQLKDSKTISFNDLANILNADTSKNIPETTQEVLVDSGSVNIKNEGIDIINSSVLDEQATSLTKNEIVTTLEDALNRLTKSNIVEEEKGVSTNETSVDEAAPKINLTATSVKSNDVSSKVDKALMITEEENKVIDAMRKSLYTETNESDDTQNSQMINKVSSEESLSKLNKDMLLAASSQPKDFKDVLRQDLPEDNLESEIETELEFASKDLPQEEDDTSNDPSGKGNQLLEDMEEANKSDLLTVEESVVADSSDNDDASFRLNDQATKSTDKVDISKQSSSNITASNGGSKNDNLVNNFNNQLNQTTEKTTENNKGVTQQRGNPVPVYDLKNSSDIGKLVKSIDQLMLKGESKLTVNLYPEHLGKLEIQLAEVAGKMTAKFITESESSHKIMISQTEALRNHLSEKGIVVDNMEFKFDDSSRQQQQQQQQQAESERRSAARNEANKKNENKDSPLERDNNINFRAKAKRGIYA